MATDTGREWVNRGAFEPGNYYRYTLTMPNGEAYPRDEIISWMHKAFRNRRLDFVMYLVECFFGAVDTVAKPLPTSLVGSVSNFINRFAICFVEEGYALELASGPVNLLRRAVAKLLKLREAASEGDFERCVSLCGNVLRYITHFRPARFGSYVAAMVRSEHPLCSQLQNAGAVCKLMSAENLAIIHDTSTKPVLQQLRLCLRSRAPLLLPIFYDDEGNPTEFVNCNELRKVVFMTAVCQDEYRVGLRASEYATAADTFPVAVPFVDEDTVRYGVRDMHTRAGRAGRAGGGVDEWLRQGIKVAGDGAHCRIAGVAYAEMEDHYREVKRREDGTKKRSREEGESPCAKRPRA